MYGLHDAYYSTYYNLCKSEYFSKHNNFETKNKELPKSNNLIIYLIFIQIYYRKMKLIQFQKLFIPR